MTAVKAFKDYKVYKDYYYNDMKSYSQFKNLNHFNEYTRKLRYYFKDKLNQTDYTLIDYLAKYAVKAAIGVACPKVSTIANGIDRSTDTVGRIVRKLENLGILKRLYNIRTKKGGNGANYYIFQTSAVPTLKDVDAGASMQGRGSQQNAGGSKGKDRKNKSKANIYLKLNKNIKIEKSFLYQELLDYKQINMRLINIYGFNRSNQIWKRIVWAFRNSELYKELNCRLQDLLNNDKELENKIANMIAICTQKYKENSIQKSFEGYLYTASLQLFNQIAMKFLEKYVPKSTEMNAMFFSPMYSQVSKEEPRHKYIREFYGEDWTKEI